MKSGLVIMACLIVIAVAAVTKGAERTPDRWEDLTLEQQRCFFRGYMRSNMADRCLLHQHFTLTFFVQKCFAQLLYPQIPTALLGSACKKPLVKCW